MLLEGCQAGQKNSKRSGNPQKISCSFWAIWQAVETPLVSTAKQCCPCVLDGMHQNPGISQLHMLAMCAGGSGLQPLWTFLFVTQGKQLCQGVGGLGRWPQDRDLWWASPFRPREQGAQRGDSRRTPPTAVTARSATGCLWCPPRQHPARALCVAICISKALYAHYLINPLPTHNSSLSYTTISCRIFLMYFNCYFAVTWAQQYILITPNGSLLRISGSEENGIWH